MDFHRGISLETTHGGVRVLRLNDDPEDKPKCAKTLRHPSSGAEVTIVGSAHVSSVSALEVKRDLFGRRWV